MNELFPGSRPKQKADANESAPLADRVRPSTIEEIYGQSHLIGESGPLRKFFQSGDFPSIIFWGPPGTGKTTFALMIAGTADHYFVRMSAIDSGVKEVRLVISNAQKLRRSGKRTLLFIDEIHRFSKSQQDSLLHAVERGVITLIGATTENPSFEVNAALLSRCQVYRLLPLTDADIRHVVEHAAKHDSFLSTKNIIIKDWDFLLNISGGDARTALNALELAVMLADENDNSEIVLSRETFEQALQQKTAQYDKKGESHYDTISAFIKSMRGSDPDAAIFWLAKMIESGEDPKFIARRMLIFASEDIGNADPIALTLAVSVFKAVEVIGMPEARINLAQGVTYLASCPKSNASYMAIKKAQEFVQSGVSMSVPLHLRNAPTRLMKQEGYGTGYKYPHGYPEHFVDEHYFPDEIEDIVFYRPQSSGKEEEFKSRLKKLWEQRYNNNNNNSDDEAE